MAGLRSRWIVITTSEHAEKFAKPVEHQSCNLEGVGVGGDCSNSHLTICFYSHLLKNTHRASHCLELEVIQKRHNIQNGVKWSLFCFIGIDFELLSTNSHFGLSDNIKNTVYLKYYVLGMKTITCSPIKNTHL